MIPQKFKRIPAALMFSLLAILITDSAIAKSDLVIKNYTDFKIQVTDLGLMLQKGISCAEGTRCSFSSEPSSTPTFDIPPGSKDKPSIIDPIPTWDFYNPTTLNLKVVSDEQLIKLDPNKIETVTFSNPKYETTLSIETVVSDIQHSKDDVYMHPEMAVDQTITVSIKMIGHKSIVPPANIRQSEATKAKIQKLETEGVSKVNIFNKTNPIRIAMEDNNEVQKATVVGPNKTGHIGGQVGRAKYAFDGGTYFFNAIDIKNFPSEKETIYYDQNGSYQSPNFYFDDKMDNQILFNVSFSYNFTSDEIDLTVKSTP